MISTSESGCESSGEANSEAIRKGRLRCVLGLAMVGMTTLRGVSPPRQAREAPRLAAMPAAPVPASALRVEERCP